jgi:chaperone required for assembly of F1-ATPase
LTARPGPKRFYTTVSVAPGAAPGRFQIFLDTKPVRTPHGNILEIRGRRLAATVADEWRAQGERVEPTGMPMMRLAASVADHFEPRMADVRRKVLAFGSCDLLCHRAEAPDQLVARQAATWQPYLDWLAAELGAHLVVGIGIIAIRQPAEALRALELALADLEPERLMVADALTQRFGSIILALAVLRGHASAEAALAASRLDETYQAELWGRDDEANARAGRIAAEIADLARLLALLP